MSIQDLATQASAERAERRVGWSTFRKLSPETLEELLRKPLRDEQRDSLQEYLLLERRKQKADLDIREKRGDFREKAALPIAAAVSFLGSWSAGLVFVPTEWKAGLILVFGLLGSLLWWLIRRNGFQVVTEARRQLALLGKVD